jgi:hypothetical protein
MAPAVSSARGLLVKAPFCHAFFQSTGPKDWEIRSFAPPKNLVSGATIYILQSGAPGPHCPVIGQVTFVEAVQLDTDGVLDLDVFDTNFEHHHVTRASILAMRAGWKRKSVFAWKVTAASKQMTPLAVRRTSQEVWVTITADKWVEETVEQPPPPTQSVLNFGGPSSSSLPAAPSSGTVGSGTGAQGGDSHIVDDAPDVGVDAAPLEEETPSTTPTPVASASSASSSVSSDTSVAGVAAVGNAVAASHGDASMPMFHRITHHMRIPTKPCCHPARLLG